MSIIVIGDLIIDDYRIVDVNRISPEAPCLVGSAHDQYIRLGGAANVAANIFQLDKKVCLVGQGEKDVFLPVTNSMGMECILYEGTHSTKIRFIDNKSHVQLFRYDVEKITPPDYYLDHLKYASFIDSIDFNNYNICVIVDYLKGMVRYIHRLNRCKVNIVSTKNPYPNKLITYDAINILILNEQEFNALKSTTGFSYIIKTEGDRGMSVLKANNENVFQTIKHIDGIKVEVFDVTGAGDTVTAVVAYHLDLFGFSEEKLIKACECANKEAAKVVAKLGTAVIDAKAFGM